MERVPELELMDDPEQARAYAEADFEEPHSRFIELFVDRFGVHLTGDVLDLGCGPGDICRRFARRYPQCRVHGVDASPAMLALATSANQEPDIANRIQYFSAYLPVDCLPQDHYRIVLSNSLLHHLDNPATLWQSIKRFGQTGTLVFVMDLLRPDNRDEALRLVRDYANDEPEILKKDFFNSLLAAYRPTEVEKQLTRDSLENLKIETVSDRHFIVFGRLD